MKKNKKLNFLGQGHWMLGEHGARQRELEVITECRSRCGRFCFGLASVPRAGHCTCVEVAHWESRGAGTVLRSSAKHNFHHKHCLAHPAALQGVSRRAMLEL